MSGKVIPIFPGITVPSPGVVEKPKDVPKATDITSVVNQSGENVAYKCGHIYASSFAHDFYGEIWAVNGWFLAKRDRCGECMLAEVKTCTARCALCGFIIFPGESVALYPYNPSLNPAWITRVGDRVVGCLRDICCSSPGSYAGYWDGEKFVPQFGGQTADENFWRKKRRE